MVDEHPSEEVRLKLQGQGQLIEWPTGCWQLHEAARELGQTLRGEVRSGQI